MSIGAIVTRGFGVTPSGGSTSLIVTAGYGSGTPPTPTITSRPFYRPGVMDVLDTRFTRVDVADERRIAGDEQVQ